MVTASDLAAMGARPDHALVSIVAPRDIDLEELAKAWRRGIGMRLRDRRWGPLVRDRPWWCPWRSTGRSVADPDGPGTLGGSPDPGRLLRSGGGARRPAVRHRSVRGVRSRPGVAPAAGSGTGSGAGRPPDAQHLAGLPPARARLAEGEAARRAGASAAIDISDGLAADLGHLARASGTRISLDAVPVAEGATLDEALHGGEDYELVLDHPGSRRLSGAFESAGLAPPLPIGRCTGRDGEVLLGGRVLAPTGLGAPVLPGDVGAAGAGRGPAGAVLSKPTEWRVRMTG